MDTTCESCGERKAEVEGGVGFVCGLCYCDGVGHGCQGEYTFADTVSYCADALGRELTEGELSILRAPQYVYANEERVVF